MDSTAYSLVETLVVALVVAVCAYTALGKFAPRARMRLQSGLGQKLDADGHAGWVRALGRRMTGGSPAGGCGSGCGTCGSCGPADPKAIKIHKK